jgi:hypothetical protein
MVKARIDHRVDGHFSRSDALSPFITAGMPVRAPTTMPAPNVELETSIAAAACYAMVPDAIGSGSSIFARQKCKPGRR